MAGIRDVVQLEGSSRGWQAATTQTLALRQPSYTRNKTLERPNSQGTQYKTCLAKGCMRQWGSNNYENRQGKCLTILQKWTRVICESLGLTLGATCRVHQQMRWCTTNTNKTMLLIGCKPQKCTQGSWQQRWCANLPTSDVKQETTNLCTMKYLKSKVSNDSSNRRQSHSHSKIRLPQKIKEVKGIAKGS